MTPLYRWPAFRWLFLLWWRLREREVEDVYTADTFGAPSYAHGKVTGLAPDLLVLTETTEQPYVCCGYASAAMACRTARPELADTLGATAHPIRSAGGRPHDNGSKASELRAGAKQAHGVKLDALAVAEIPGRLRAGYGVVVNLDYADLPSWLRVQGGSFGHSCALFGWREDGDLVGFFDPLWPQKARGAWAPWSEVRPALWSDGEHSSTVVRVEPEPPTPAPEPEPPAEPDCPEPDVTPADVEQARRDAVAATLVERDRAWRDVTGWSQPRMAPVAWGSRDMSGVTWSGFARFAPEPEPGTWNGATAWNGTAWR